VVLDSITEQSSRDASEVVEAVDPVYTL